MDSYSQQRVKAFSKRDDRGMQSRALGDRIEFLLGLPDVADAVAQARLACDELRWHPALRRRIAESAAESRVRGAAASASLEGAEVAGTRMSLSVVRDVMRGAVDAPAAPDPVWRTMMAAAQVTAATEMVRREHLTAPAQVLARLHVAAASPLISTAHLGRPRLAEEVCTEWVELGPAPVQAEMQERLAGISELVLAAQAGRGPTLVFGALIHAELIAVRPFVAGNGLVARAMERSVLILAGVDPTGVAVVEAGHSAGAGTAYRGAMTAYVDGGRAGLGLWLVHCAEAVARGAAQGVAIADAVLAGRLDAQGLPAT